jgi:CoA:oxalate CoA-transferase
VPECSICVAIRTGRRSFPHLALVTSVTGVHALAALTSALFGRERSGLGQFVETSLLNCYFGYHELNVQMLSASRGTMKPRRTGEHHYMVAPAGMFKGKHTYLLIIGGLDRQWPAMCQAMNRPDLVNDPRFNSIALRAQNIAEVIRIVQDWVDAHEDEEVEQALEKYRVPFAPASSAATPNCPDHPRPFPGRVRDSGFSAALFRL